MPLLTLLTGTTTPLFSPISSSMEPTVSPGDLAIVTHVYPRSLQVGDIIVYDKLMETLQSTPSQISSPTLHRIARIVVVNNQRFFVTKGDNNPDEDTWFVPEEGVIGKVVFVFPFVGNIFLLLSQLEVKVGVIVAAVAIIALWPSKKAKTKPEMKNYEKEKITNH
jgi:signal peptidase